ncbi:MAG: insulinase family protein [Clostridia bacterium]|nr:insulinase family protein [Clostridia bacterium]
MKYIKQNIKDGVTLHLIINENFKTDFSVVFISIPLEKENITKNALIPAVIKNGSKKYNNYQLINEELEMLYGASFDCGLDKTGDNLVLKFYIESINDNFLPEKNENLEQVLNLLLEIVFNPLVENESFKNQYVELEKKNLELLINSVKDDKDIYSYEKCINIMYKNSGYGLSKYGNIEDLKTINSKNLYSRYKEIISKGKIDIIVSGNYEKEKIQRQIEENQFIKNLNSREDILNINNFKTELKEKIDNPETVKEEMDVTQGKLVIGLDILPNNLEDFRFIAIMYNAIFGNGVNSKLFQIVREKESLAYTAKSEYVVQKNNIFIRCGIECEKYDKTVELIKVLLEQMKNGEFTEEDINKTKEYIISGIDSINEEQDTQILYLFGQELSKLPLKTEEYKEKIKAVTKEQITEFAQSIQLNTIYFLKSGGENADN